jgi:hypothetical protein
VYSNTIFVVFLTGQVDWTTAEPHGSHVLTTRANGDKKKPEIYCMALSPDSRTVAMADSNNQNIKLISDFSSGSLSAIALDSPPRSLVWVFEGQLAVTPLYNMKIFSG